MKYLYFRNYIYVNLIFFKLYLNILMSKSVSHFALSGALEGL